MKRIYALTLLLFSFVSTLLAEDITVYFVNTKEWNNVYAYVWPSDGTGLVTWPGENMRLEGYDYNGNEVYSYTFDFSKATNIIFNDSDDQTEDLFVYKNKTYYYDGLWYTDYTYMSNSIKTSINGIYYILDHTTKTAMVTYKGHYSSDYTNEYLGDISIPETITYNSETYSVTSIGEYAFADCSTLTSVSIGNSVTSIGYAAFAKCSTLTSVSIGNSVTTIGDFAFEDCSKLTSVSIPNSVNSIGRRAFIRCIRLTEVTIPNSVTSIGDYAFNDCSRLTSVIWNAKNYKDFEDYDETPFYYIRSKITSFTFGNEVEHIPAYLCYDMSGLTEMTIPNSVTSIGYGAFNSCSGLTSVIWNPKNYKDFSYSDNAPFYYISSKITSFTFGNEVEHIPAYLCYDMSGLKTISVPTNVKSIGDKSFYKCYNLKKVSNFSGLDIVSGETTHGCVAYYADVVGNKIEGDFVYDNNDVITEYIGDSNVTSITIPLKAKGIYGTVFTECTKLISVVWNAKNCEDFSSPTYSPFYEICSKITSFTIGNEVEHIPAYLCYEMSNLTKVNYLGTVDQWLKFDFKNYYDNPIYYAKNLYINGELLTDLKITATNTIKKYTFYNCRNIKSVEIGNSVTSIGNDAFKGCSGLTSVIWNAKKFSDFSDYDDVPFYNIRSQITSFTIGNEVEHIPAYLCYGMSKLQTITIPNSATSIGNSAFRWCSGLMSVTIPNSVTTIGNSVFSDCSKLTSITIPNSVTSIGSNAFYGCSGLTSITIPNRVTSIGTEAFSGCSGLTKVNYLGTVDKWAEFDWDNSNSNPTYYAKDLYINDELLTDLKITSADSIKKYAFYNCQSIKSVETGNSVNLIGTEAFSGCSALTSVSIGESVTSIGSRAFYGCDKLRKVTAYPTTVPSVYESSFAHYNAALYVPCDVYDDYFYDEVLGTFKVTDCIAAQEVDAPEKVEIEVDEDNNANVIWPSTDGAKKYELEISKNGEVFCTLLFNENGQLTSIDFGNRSASVGFQFTVTGLDGASKYAYSMVAMDKKGNELQSYKGTFTTNGYVPGPDDIEDPEDPDNPDDSGDITTSATETLADVNITVSNGTISADSTFSIYNTIGQNVTALNGSLQPGIYVVALGADRVKVMIK